MPEKNETRSQIRDKPKHSKKGGGIARMTVKKGGAGARAWGKPGDEIIAEQDRHYLNENDPNYDPMEGASAPIPIMEAQARFVSTAADLSAYKKSIKSAITEFLVSEDTKEFARVVVELDMTVYHQELTKIVVTKGLDQKVENRVKLSSLLAYLHTEGHLTRLQSKAGFTKLYHRLDELLVDAPNALAVLREFTEHAVSNGFLEPSDVDEFQAEAKLQSDSKAVAAAKVKIKIYVTEYLSSEDVNDLCESVSELKAKEMGHEVVKRLIYAGCDGNARNKELVSVFLAEVPSSIIPNEQIAKGFSILLERTEDMFLDTPDILYLLATFIARAVVDEALPPSFLVRQDLEQADMGFQVISYAQKLTSRQGASSRLADAWIQSS